MPKYTYSELSRCKITKTRDAVFSTCSNGSYTLAQQATITEEDDTRTKVFFKGALHIASLEEVKAVRDMLDDSIRRIEEKKALEEEEAWDLIEEEERAGA